MSIAWEHTNEVRLQIQADYRRCERGTTIEHDERRGEKKNNNTLQYNSIEKKKLDA